MRRTVGLVLAGIICLLAPVFYLISGPFPSGHGADTYPLCCGSEAAGFVQLMGRGYYTEDTLICDHSASGICFRAGIQGSLSLKLHCSGLCYFTVYIDGVRQDDRIAVPQGTHTVEFACFEEFGIHTVTLVRQTEAALALCSLESLIFQGSILDLPERSEPFLVFIGDSITAGYGNLCSGSCPNPGGPENQDATRAFAYLTAKELNADYEIVCCSGIGIARGFVSCRMEEYFPASSFHRNPEEPYHASRIPDVIILNLGTNDAAWGSTAQELEQEVADLITLLAKIYGEDVPILWVHGMMGQGCWPQIEQALQNTSAPAYSLQLEHNADGGASHPDADAHCDAAQKLAQFLREHIFQ